MLSVAKASLLVLEALKGREFALEKDHHTSVSFSPSSLGIHYQPLWARRTGGQIQFNSTQKLHCTCGCKLCSTETHVKTHYHLWPRILTGR